MLLNHLFITKRTILCKLLCTLVCEYHFPYVWHIVYRDILKKKSHDRWAIKNHMTQIWKHLNIVLFYLFENMNHHQPLSNLVNVMRIYTFTTFFILERRSSPSRSHSSFAPSCSSSSSLRSQTQRWKIVWIWLSTLFLHKNLLVSKLGWERPGDKRRSHVLSKRIA